MVFFAMTVLCPKGKFKVVAAVEAATTVESLAISPEIAQVVLVEGLSLRGFNVL